ncbi:hypothetical protein RC62_3568 [Flavobacterium aquidurense]|uniref:Uncharacterized protein n=1 Tax=Flavobacterium aquidurense TaxID=362413 RepID=A0A0Q0SBR8_9FLAO|nr:hypothetical protein RC62_3568 [Flavobacterium aquidurense]
MLVHKSIYARDAKVYAIQELRNQIGKYRIINENTTFKKRH